MIKLSGAAALIPVGIVFAGVLAAAPAGAQTPTTGPILRFTATTENVSGAPDSIQIDVLRWSTDAERDQLLAAWNLTAPAENTESGGGRGGAGRGGRGRGAAPAPAPRRTPESSLTAALGKAPTVGYLWSSEVAGYSLHYAIRTAAPDGGERIVLITDRRLGMWNNLWKPSGPGPTTNYEFSVVEIHLNAKGEGEGKVSLTGKVTVDKAAKTIALENYDALPAVLKNVRRQSPESALSK
jgi:hypothetical protein